LYIININVNININSIPSFVVLLNCLYLNLRVLLFVHSLPLPTAGGRGLSEQLSGPSCRLQSQHRAH